MKRAPFRLIVAFLAALAAAQDLGMVPPGVSPSPPPLEQQMPPQPAYGPPPGYQGYPPQGPPFQGPPQQPPMAQPYWDQGQPTSYPQRSRRLSHRTTSRRASKARTVRPKRRAYLNTTFESYTPPQQNLSPNPNNPDFISAAAENERRGPIDYYPHFSWFNRFESFPGFNNWFINLWRQGRFTHEYRYDLIDTNFFMGNPETVGNPVFSDQEAVDLQNYEQHFAHLQKILADERTDQDFVMAYSRERNAHERMLRFRENRNNVYQSILQMEQVIYGEQDSVFNQTRARVQKREADTVANITAALQGLNGKPFFAKSPAPLDIFAS